MKHKQYGIQRSPKDRVKRGITWLDSNVNRDILPADWRSRLNVEDMRFFDPDRGPLGQLFGSYYAGLNKLRIAGGGGSEFGFRNRHHEPGDCERLKAAWREALRTEPRWSKRGYGMIRRIRGVRFLIAPAFHPDGVMRNSPNVGRFQVVEFKGGQRREFPNLYLTYDSAARAVRRRFNEI